MSIISYWRVRENSELFTIVLIKSLYTLTDKEKYLCSFKFLFSIAIKNYILLKISSRSSPFRWFIGKLRKLPCSENGYRGITGKGPVFDGKLLWVRSLSRRAPRHPRYLHASLSRNTTVEMFSREKMLGATGGPGRGGAEENEVDWKRQGRKITFLLLSALASFRFLPFFPCSST